MVKSPIRTVALIATVTEPTVVQETPSAERAAVITFPTRTSRTQVGANAAAAVPTTAESPPVVPREISCGPCEAVVTIATCLELAASASRIMTPALAWGLVAWFWVTRATIEPSPLSVCQTKRKASVVPPTLAPAPATVNSPAAKVASPGRRLMSPTSADVQPSGRSFTVRS